MTVYYTSFRGVTVSAAQDFFEIVADSNFPLNVLRIVITQNSSETSEQLSLIVKRVTGAPTSGSGGSTHTPVAAGYDIGAAFGGTVEINNTTELTGGTQEEFWQEGFNVIGGFYWRATPEDVISCGPGDRIVVNLPAAPTSGIPMNGLVVFDSGH